MFFFDAAPGTAFTLSGTVHFGAGPPGPVGGGGVVRLTGPGVNISGPDMVWWSSANYNHAGVLTGGTYRLEITAFGSGGVMQSRWWTGSGSNIGSLVLSPAPGSAALLALPALAVLRRRR